MINSIIKEKLVYATNIQYIGNCKDFIEPFGAFCDLRIYNTFIDDIKVYNIFNGMNFILDVKTILNTKSDNIIKISRAFTEILNNRLPYSKDRSEETFSYVIKLINNLLSNELNRSGLIQYSFIMENLGIFRYNNKNVTKENAKWFSSLG